MLVLNLTIHHLWGRILEKFPETRVVVYADDGGETTTDAYISSRQWDVGHYQIRLNTFDGYWSGTVKILIQPSELE